MTVKHETPCRSGQSRYPSPMTTDSPAPAIPRSLFVFTTLYGGMTVLAGVLGA